jgi:hypothetical protein
MQNTHELLELVDQATEAIESYSELNAICPFDTGAEFAVALRALKQRILQMDWSALRELAIIFAPTCAWDDAVGGTGSDLANQIMAMLDVLRAEGLFKY